MDDTTGPATVTGMLPFASLELPSLELPSLELPADAPLDPVPAAADDLLMLIFTSGTSGEPKAVRCTHGKIALPGRMLADRFGLGAADTVYVSMPMFHSNAIMAGWAVGLAAGAAIALRRRFSASAFLADVRAFGATYANYVGKPLSYVLPRRSALTTPTTHCASPTATRARRATWPGSPSGSAAG